MKKLLLFLCILASIQVANAQKLSPDATTSLIKKSNALMCSAHEQILTLFITWDENKYTEAYQKISEAHKNFITILEKGTYSSEMMANLFIQSVTTRKNNAETELNYYLGDTFVSEIKKAEDLKKMKFEGTKYYVPNSLVSTFELLTATKTNYCK